jgi:8-oxo-dGTP pyrophosphatase MutT (NUDIX family)
MRAHLSACYQVPDNALIELPNGLSPTDWRLTPPNSGLLPNPARDGFMLAMGRAQPYKGFDDLVDALALLRQQYLAVPHLVLAAVTDNPELSSYQQRLAAKITNEGLDITLLTRFHPDIRRLLAHPALRGVVVPSRAEPFGRVPIEASAAGASPVIATTVGGLAEQVSDGHTGFTAAPQDPISLAAALRRAVTLTPAGRHRMRDNARRFAAARYDYPLTVRKFLTQVAPWHPEQPGGSSIDVEGGQCRRPRWWDIPPPKQPTTVRVRMARMELADPAHRPHQRLRYRACVDVHLILRRGERVLLGQRQNTGFADGSWHLPSGHTEDGESATAALIREADEEIGVRIDPAEVRFVHLMHHRTGSGRIALFFEVTRWHGEPDNREPDKCVRWDWFPLTELPADMIPYAAQALTHYTKGDAYAERNWPHR